MKPAILLVFIVTMLVSCQTEPDTQTKKEELKAVLSDYYDAMSKKDLTIMNSLTTGNFILYDEGVIYNNESALKAMQQMPSFMATFTFDSINAHIDKTNASAYYLRSAVFTIEDSLYPPIKFLESATFTREGGKWKLRFLHSSMRK